jgi:basic membrane lipoprotein Med (substrate-binding protein (PBP1-ABC) superfamily)
MKQKKLLAVGLSAAIVLSLLAGCSSSGSSSTPTPTASATPEATASAPVDEGKLTPESIAAAAAKVEVPTVFNGLAYQDLKAAILVPDSYTEPGWSQTGAIGMQAIGEELGCTATIVEAASPDQMKTEAEALADEGYQLIIGHGNQYADAFNEICLDYPDTFFVTIGGTAFNQNLIPYYSDLGQPYYLVGVIAGLMTENNKTAFIAGANWNSFMKEAYSFYEGVKSVNPDCEFSLVVMNDYTDSNEAYESAVSLINAGVDYIAVSANASNSAVMQACQDKGVKCTSDGADYSKDYPDAAFISIRSTFANCFPVFAKALCDGTFQVDPTGDTCFAYNDGYWNVIPNPNFKFSDEAKAKYDEVMADPASLFSISELDITLGTYVYNGG